MTQHDSRIVIDGRDITPQCSGVGRYAAGLVGALARLQGSRPMTVLALDGYVAFVRGIIAMSDRVTAHPVPFQPWSLRNQLLLPRLLRQLGAGLYHCPYLYAPVMSRSVKVVITVHDLIPHLYRKHLARSSKSRWHLVWNTWCRVQYAKADAIVTVSEHSSSDLLRHTHIPASKVTRIYNGVLQHDSATSAKIIRSRWNLRGRVICTVSRHDPYKNISSLVQAFGILRAKLNQPMTLVIAGQPDHRYQEPQQLVRQLGLDNAVVFTGYLTDEERTGLLRMCDLFAYPSLYEGFGLPPLEAMAEGAPVVCSNASSLPEVVGDAALLFDPANVQQMADCMHRVLCDASLAKRLRAAGPQRAAQFSWQRSAEAHLALYEATLAAGP